MNKYEFITNLQRHLTGKVSAEKLRELTQYYSDYIDSEIRKGKSEEEVLRALGDPRLLAKTIVETEGSGVYRDTSQLYEDENRERENRGRMFGINLKNWVIFLLAILIIFVIFYILFGIIGLAFSLFFRYVLPIAIPVFIIYMVIQLFKR